RCRSRSRRNDSLTRSCSTWNLNRFNRETQSPDMSPGLGCIFLRPLQKSQCYSTQDDKYYCCSSKSTEPDPILNHPGMASASRQVQPQLPKCSQIRVQK